MVDVPYQVRMRFNLIIRCVSESVSELSGGGSATNRATCLVFILSYNSALMLMFSNCVSRSLKYFYSDNLSVLELSPYS